MWCSDENSWFIWPFSDSAEPTIEPPCNKCCRNVDDTEEEDRVVSLIDYRRNVTPGTRNPLGIQTTPVLDDFPLFNLCRVESNPLDNQLIITNRI